MHLGAVISTGAALRAARQGEAMPRIHEVIEDLRGLPDVEVTPIGAALEELLGRERGSLAELAHRSTEAGLGHIMASWIGNGPEIRTGGRSNSSGGRRARELEATLNAAIENVRHGKNLRQFPQ